VGVNIEDGRPGDARPGLCPGRVDPRHQVGRARPVRQRPDRYPLATSIRTLTRRCGASPPTVRPRRRCLRAGSRGGGRHQARGGGPGLPVNLLAGRHAVALLADLAARVSFGSLLFRGALEATVAIARSVARARRARACPRTTRSPPWSRLTRATRDRP
jgi:hypothetical protein